MIFLPRKTKEYEKGFTIAEVLISITVLSFGIILIYSAFTSIVNTTYTISARSGAIYLAQEGIEIIRNIRDNNFLKRADNPNFSWSAGLMNGPCATGCMADYKTNHYSQLLGNTDTFLSLNSDGFYSYDYGGLPTIFKRKILINPLEGTSDALKVQSMVTWDYNNQSYSFEASEYLYNWK